MSESSYGLDTLTACFSGVELDLDHPGLPFLEEPPVNFVTGEQMNGTAFETAQGGSVALRRGRLRMGRGCPLQAWVVKGGIKVQMSLARKGGTEGPNVLPALSAEDLWRRIRSIKRLFRDRGLTVDLEAGRLLRVDLFRDVALPLRLHEYGKALDACGLWPMTPTDAKELFGRGHRVTTSYACYNADRGLTVYDKRDELGLVGRAPESGCGCIARVEDRYRTERAMKQLGVETVADLVEHWETICHAFDSSIEERFGKPPEGAAPPLDGRRMGEGELFGALKARRKRDGDAIHDLLEVLALESYGVENMRELLKREGCTATQIQRAIDSKLDFIRSDGPTCGELKASIASALAGPAYAWPEFADKEEQGGSAA